MHIGGGTGNLGRLSGIPIGQGGDDLIGEAFSHLVDKVQQRAHGAAVDFIQGLAGRAAAVAVMVVLADRPIKLIGLLRHKTGQPLDHDLQHLGVGKAKLALGIALAVDHGEILRMLVEIVPGGHELVEAVAPEAPAGMLLKGMHFALSGKDRVAVIPVVKLAELEDRISLIILHIQGKIGLMRDFFNL